MTVYFIYIHGNELNPLLYALTDEKDLMKSFMRERKNEMFVVKEKDMTKESFLEICKKHSGYLLVRRGLETKSSSNFKSEKDIIYLTTTSNEEMDIIIRTDSVILNIGKFTDAISSCFNTKILKALNELEYFKVYKFCNRGEGDCLTDFLSGIYSYDMENYRFDEFGIFMMLYGETIDKEGILKNGK